MILFKNIESCGAYLVEDIAGLPGRRYLRLYLGSWSSSLTSAVDPDRRVWKTCTVTDNLAALNCALGC
ncbi:hypothetical protein O9993_10340 [Vibrio lentus]|nr:hypothetical protein [Vibrio lentus]